MARRKSALFVAFTFLAAGTAAAPPYPSQPITVVPSSAGGTRDAPAGLRQGALARQSVRPTGLDDKAGASGVTFTPAEFSQTLRSSHAGLRETITPFNIHVE